MQTTPHHTHATDRAKVEAAARALAANIMFPKGASEALTAALRMLDRQAAELQELRADLNRLAKGTADLARGCASSCGLKPGAY